MSQVQRLSWQVSLLSLAAPKTAQVLVRKGAAVTQLKPNIQKPIDKIVEILNEAVTVGGMTKEETEALHRAFVNLVAAILSN